MKIKQNMTLFIHTQKQKQQSVKVTLIMCLNQHILQLYISNIQKFILKGSCWIIDSVIDHDISISKYNPFVGSSYLKLPKEIDHPKKGLINIQNDDGNKWCEVRYLNPAYHNPARIAKSKKDFSKKLNFKNKS